MSKKRDQESGVKGHKKPPAKKKLLARQRLFVDEYLKCWNASEAARRAGYKGRADQIGYRLLRNVEISALISERLTESAMDSNEVLARLADQARGTLDDFVNDKGAIDLAKARKSGKAHLLKAYSQTTTGTRIEIYDAQSALVQIGRHHGLFVDKIEVDEPMLIKMDK